MKRIGFLALLCAVLLIGIRGGKGDYSKMIGYAERR